MIITRYLVLETFKNQLVILSVLLLVFFCQKLVRILNAVVNGDIPANFILPLLSIGIPETAQLILPMSLFLGLLVTLTRMHGTSEIKVMHACGLGKNVLIRTALLLSLITATTAMVNIVWLVPWSLRYQNKVMVEARTNLSIATLVDGQFKSAENGNLVLFVSNVNNNKFGRIFLAQLQPKNDSYPSVIIGNNGHIVQQSDGSKLIMLDKGTRYEGKALFRNFRITDFIKYKAVIGYRLISGNKIIFEYMTFRQLWCTSDIKAKAELHWRLTLVISTLIMALVVIPLSSMSPNQGRIINVVPSMMLYLTFFLLQTSLHSNGAKGERNPMIWMWTINIVYLFIALVLNLWDSVMIRNLRDRVYKKRND